MDRKELKQIPAARIPLEPPEMSPPGKVVFYPVNSLGDYRVVNIFARYDGQWLYSRAKTREIFEMPGGHVESGETALEAAKRELYEETGAAGFEIEAVFDFTWLNSRGENWNCQAFYAQIHTLGEMPNFEMEEAGLCGGVPERTRFPDITEALFRKMQGWLNLQTAKDELWDVYDANRNKTGRMHRRGDQLASGDYHLTVTVILTNKRGEYFKNGKR